MKILFVVSELNPIIKTGGLADVASALPKELVRSGVDVRIVLPDYPALNKKKLSYANQPEIFKISTPTQKIDCWVSQVLLPGSSIPVHLFKTGRGLTKSAIYPTTEEGDQDRFLWFALAVIEWLKSSTWQPDIVHCHDWMTALIPQLLKQNKLHPKSLLTIHNLFYQGITPIALFDNLGVEVSSLSPQVNLLRLGINAATKINTVSPTYAKEALTLEYGCGLEQALKKRKQDFHGILNGIDDVLYNPIHDTFIPFPYSIEDANRAKSGNKEQLQNELGLEINSSVPMYGFVSRLTDQKGLSLIEKVLQSSPLLHHAQVIILGIGEKYWERRLKILADQRSKSLRVVTRFDEELAHKIYAASDFTLLPSKFEPCGLTQLIAMKYGSIPIVRKTGGLADTVIDQISNPDRGTGLVFEKFTAREFSQVLGKSMGLYQQLNQLSAMRSRAMSKDFSWEASAQQYIQLYKGMIDNA